MATTTFPSSSKTIPSPAYARRPSQISLISHYFSFQKHQFSDELKKYHV